MMPLDPNRKFVQRYDLPVTDEEVTDGQDPTGPFCLWDDVRHALDDAEGQLVAAEFVIQLYKLAGLVMTLVWVIAWQAAR